MDSTTLISIIVPVYNEESNLHRTYNELVRVTNALSDYRFEFIFTDNHSTDGTFTLLSEIAQLDPRVRVARFARNFGFQRSVLTGYRLAEGAAAIQVDADLQDPPEMFGAMLEQWRLGHDVVAGVRRNRMEGKFLLWMRRTYYRLLTHLDGPHLIADAGDFRLIDRTIIEELRVIEDAHPYLRGLISSLASNQIGIPYDRNNRMHGASKFPLPRLFQMAADGIIAHSALPLRVALYIGMLTAFAATGLAVYYLVVRLFFGADWPAGFATTQVLILFGIGLNAILLGIIGEYVGRIYSQVRTRPTTIVQRVLNFERSVEDINRSLGLPTSRR